MKYLHFHIVLIGCISVFSTRLMAQNTFEQLPRHQLNASFGKTKTSISKNPNTSNINTIGLAYTFNATRRLWLSAEGQSGFTRFDWRDYKLEVVGTNGAIKIKEIPVFYQNNMYDYLYQSNIVAGVPSVLIPSTGFYEYRSAALLVGIQRSTARDALRFGLGGSRTYIRLRDIEIYNYNGQLTNQYLVELATWMWTVNGTLQYDYWLTPKISLGMRMSIILRPDYREDAHNFSAMFSVGYAIPQVRKKVSKPQA
jgi:hypothetical protein